MFTSQEIFKSMGSDLFTMKNIKSGLKAGFKRREGHKRAVILCCVAAYMLVDLVSRIDLLMNIPFIRYK